MHPNQLHIRDHASGFTIVTSLSIHDIKIMGLAAGAGSDQQMQFPLDQDKRPRYIAYSIL